jgi:GPH family glycoside/pentoside/hexuronide:cation symporter
MALKNSEVVKYSLYGPLSGIALALPMSYFTAFQTEGLGWTAALATTVLLIPRAIDFIFGFLAGVIVAKTNLKWGKYRSWFVLGAWVAFAGIVMMFLNTKSAPLPGQIAISALGYTFQNVPMNFIVTAQFGLMMLMGGASMDDRIKLSVTTTRFTMIGTLVSSAGLVPALAALTKVFGANPDNPNWYHPNAYMVVGMITALLFLVGAFSVLSASKNYDKPGMGMGGPSLTIGEILKGVASNDQLLVYTLVSTIVSVSMFTIMPLAVFYYMYVLGNMMLMPIGMTIMTLFGVVASMVGPVIGKKIGKKRALQTGQVITIIDSALIALLAGNTTTIAGGIQLGFVIYVALSCITMIGSNIWMGFGGNYFVDAGEYGLWKTGKDNRAVAMGLGSPPVKVALIVGGALGGYALHAIGYRPGMGMPGGPAFPANFTRSFMLLLGGVPAVLSFLGLIIFSLGWKITDADAAKYAKENMERAMAANPGAAGPAS